MLVRKTEGKEETGESSLNDRHAGSGALILGCRAKAMHPPSSSLVTGKALSWERSSNHMSSGIRQKFHCFWEGKKAKHIPISGTGVGNVLFPKIQAQIHCFWKGLRSKDSLLPGKRLETGFDPGCFITKQRSAFSGERSRNSSLRSVTDTGIDFHHYGKENAWTPRKPNREGTAVRFPDFLFAAFVPDRAQEKLTTWKCYQMKTKGKAPRNS